MGGLLHLEQPGGLKDDTYLLISVGVRGAVLGMALRRDVARCVKVVDILTVDRLCDMTCQHYDWMMTRVFSDKNRYDVDKMAQAIKIDVTQCLRKCL